MDVTYRNARGEPLERRQIAEADWSSAELEAVVRAVYQRIQREYTDEQ